MYPREILHWINDAEVAASSAQTFDKRCPIDDRVIAQVARGTAEDVRRATAMAASAAEAWGRVPPPRRGEVLGRAAALLRLKEREFGDIVRTETGKPWKNAVAEVGSSADLGIFMASEGSRFYGKTMTSPIANRSVRTERAPIGVCAAIMPFNSPLAGIAWKVFPALLCGNAVVAKSHELTPYTAVAFGKLLQEAGLPRGLYSAVQGLGPEVGTALVEDSHVDLVSFTGSVATGRMIQKTVSGRPTCMRSTIATSFSNTPSARNCAIRRWQVATDALASVAITRSGVAALSCSRLRIRTSSRSSAMRCPGMKCSVR